MKRTDTIRGEIVWRIILADDDREQQKAGQFKPPALVVQSPPDFARSNQQDVVTVTGGSAALFVWVRLAVPASFLSRHRTKRVR
ncbi:MAG: hypothetical protein ACLQVM_08575 [Terriglobia bacterium]